MAKKLIVMWFFLGLSVLTALFMGCSSSKQQTGYDPDTGQHTGWNGMSHGVAAKTQADGFASCQACHGTDLTGGVSATSCFSCHEGNALHPVPAWKGTVKHAATNPANAEICAGCHSSGANSSLKPLQSPAAGATPGCFNNTLCHATAGHAQGWSTADQHGAAAKAAAGGFTSCTSCHGADYSGGTSGIACAVCHGGNAPHPVAPWIGTIRTHATTAPENASACSLCHLNGANSSRQPSSPAPSGTAPGCFNNTLCHATAGHAAGWSSASQHGVSAEQNFASCATCHGSTYKGGTATTSCYQCHNGPGLNHPAPDWILSNHKTAALADSTGCKKCHGADYLGGGSGTACTNCHMENQTKVHRINWYPDVSLNHRSYAKTNGTATCANASCHGADLTGVTLSGPSCSSCHSWPFTAASCGSCHGTPPAGTASPNRAGRHAVHAALSTNISCATCHQGAGSGTSLHSNNSTEVSLDSAFAAKSGTPAFNGTAGTCSNIRCHGGKTTPAWLTGTIDVNTQCTSCHASGTTQYNSYNSGQHGKHVSRFACTKCHDTTKLAKNHFTRLDTAAMEGPASGTIVTSVNYNGASCNPSAGGMTGCHSSEAW